MLLDMFALAFQNGVVTIWRRDAMTFRLFSTAFRILSLHSISRFFFFFLCCRRECVACSFFCDCIFFCGLLANWFFFFFVAEKVIKFNEAVEASARTNLKAPIQSGESAYSPLSSY